MPKAEEQIPVKKFSLEGYMDETLRNAAGLISRGKINEAELLVSQYESKNGEHAESLSIRAAIKLLSNKLDEAELLLQKGLALNREAFDILNNLGTLYCLKGQIGFALAFYKRAFEVSESEQAKMETLDTINRIEQQMGVLKASRSGEKKLKKPLLSVMVLAYNHLDYTKLCVESILQNASSIDYELITVNNGSGDGTEEYFQELSHSKKITFPVNMGGDTPVNAGLRLAEGEYVLFVSNDLIFTPNSIQNLLKCIQSDPQIAMVVPVCNSASNYQRVHLKYSTPEELKQAAFQYNISDPRKWEERIRLVTYTFMARTELIKRIGGIDEIYSPGGFEDDDISFRLRRAGYRLILARDTFIHHFGSVTMKDDYARSNQLDRNRRIFNVKYRVDSWEDAFIDFEALKMFEMSDKNHSSVLGFCSSCGGTLLHIKNIFKVKGLKDTELYSITEEEKYLADLKSFCKNAFLDKYENISKLVEDKKFDYVLIEQELQNLTNPRALLENIANLLGNGGQLVFSIANPSFYTNLLDMMDIGTPSDRNLSKSGTLYYKTEAVLKLLEELGLEDVNVHMCTEEVPDSYFEALEILKKLYVSDDSEKAEQMLRTRRFIISAVKKSRFKNILLYPGYDYWLQNKIFEDNSIGNFLGIDLGNNMPALLRDAFRSRGYRLSTIDMVEMDKAYAIIFFDLPKPYNNPFYKNAFAHLYKGSLYLDKCLGLGKRPKLILIIMEPPFVMPENYNSKLHEPFDMVFTYSEDMVDNVKYFKYNYSQPSNVLCIYRKDFSERKLCTLIACNKYSSFPGELYSERRKAIDFFEKNKVDGFSFYGRGWSKEDHPCFEGAVENKIEVLSRYKFCICYENGILNGYITEKLFDCFFSRCIPIYLGAPNIKEYIPENTFIDFRNFNSYEELHYFMLSMKEEEFEAYIRNIEAFLQSPGFSVFTHEYFSKQLIDTMEQRLPSIDKTRGE